MHGRALRGRVDELLERFGLREVSNRIARTYSGGMQRKLDVRWGLCTACGSSSSTSRQPDSIRRPRRAGNEIGRLTSSEGLTILLTTHYLEEADRLANGWRSSIAADLVSTPEELKADRAMQSTSS